MSLIQLDDTIPSALAKMSAGNPGAITVLLRIFKEGDAIDPQSWSGGFGTILALDTHKIYGEDIWILYKYICGEDIVNVCAVLRAVQLGILPEEDMKAAIFHYRELAAGTLTRPLDMPTILKAVMDQLEEFNRHKEGSPV